MSLASFSLALCLSLCLYSCVGDIVIGEMLEGNSYDKRITLHNVGTAAENLTAYSLNIYMNAADTATYSLHPVSAAILQAQGNYSICHPRSRESCDHIWSGINFNGNDFIELRQNSVAVDVIGQPGGIGVESGGWRVGGVRAATRNHLIVRKEEIQTGNVDWPSSAESEWLVYTLDGQLVEEGHSTSSPTQPPSAPCAASDIGDDCWNVSTALNSELLDTCRAAVEKESIVVGSYNTLFLFDGESDPRVQDRWTSEIEAQQHLCDVADVIRRHRPDIMTLQEVEDLDILRDLVAEISDPEYDPFLVNGRDTLTRQDVAVIVQQDVDPHDVSRTDCRTCGVPPGSRCGVPSTRIIGVSKNMIALFDSCLFGRKFAVVTMHFYAFPTSRTRCIEREAQAHVMQNVLTRLIEAGFEIILTGDLNDYSDVYEDAVGHVPISRVLSMLRDPDNDGQDELSNFLEFVPRVERYSAWYDRDSDDDFAGIEETSEIDHILVTRGFHDRIRRAWIDHDIDPERVSDHWPIFLELSTGPNQTT